MNFIKNLLFGAGGQDKQNEDNFAEDDLTRILTADDIEQIITTNIKQAQFCQFKPTQKGQQKHTIFLNSDVWITSKEFQVEGQKSTVYVIQLTNEDYDETQDQEPLKQLPLTKDLQFLQYTGFTEDGENQVIGFAFIYHDYNLVYSIEQIVDVTDKAKEHEQRDMFDNFRVSVCQILLAINEGRNYKKVTQKHLSQYCNTTTLDFILNTPNLLAQLQQTAAGLKGIPSYKYNLSTVEKKYEENQVKDVIKKMKSLDVMKEEIKNVDEVQVEIKSRLLQILGDLYEYNPLEDANQIRVRDIFLCLDKVGEFEYLMNIVDKQGKVSYTRKTVTNLSDFQLDQSTQGVCFIGQPRKNGYIPGYFFYVPSKNDFDNLRGLLAKCVFESQNKVSYDKANKDEEEGIYDYYSYQMNSDVANNDVNMQQVEDDTDDFDYVQAELDLQKEEIEEYENLVGLLQSEEAGQYRSSNRYNDQYQEEIKEEEDREEDSYEEVKESGKTKGPSKKDDMRNKETLQAHLYDRTFILNGPVVKVYQNVEESGLGNVYDHQRLQYCMDLPVVKNADGDDIHPSNLLLHENESHLVFKNERDPTKVYIFDLESGKILQTLNTGKNELNFKQLTNEFKNGQEQPERTLYGIESQGIYQIDPRVADNSIVASKAYKTDVNFSSICPTMAGGFAIGSLNGEIRMYKQVGQNAKTLLPGLGEPVKSVDISLDQQWLLATCTTYLLVVPTVISSGANGFEKPMGKEKPNPMKLALNPRDIVKYQIQNVNFTPAKFNNGEKIQENSIVTSTGNLLITWNFEKVKRGVLRSYKIKNLHQYAVEGQFQFNNDEKLLVTLPHDVKMETRKRNKKEK